MNKKSVESLNMLIGLIFVAIIIVLVVAITVMGTSQFLEMIQKALGIWAKNTFNPDSALSLASKANFDRLNTEVSLLLKQAGNPASVVIPYTLGQYRLVGFNRAQDNDLTNNACLGKEMAARPPECKDQACLCLCLEDESCDCKTYPGIDYIITMPGQSKNDGKVIDGLADPVTGDQVKCLKILGADTPLEHIKAIEPRDHWFGSQNVYLEKSQKNGKNFLFFASTDDLQFTTRVLGDTNKNCGTGIYDPELPVDYSKCQGWTNCMNYTNVDIGCDWKIACQNNVCERTNQLMCEVKTNPLGITDAEKTLCLPYGQEVSDICLQSPDPNSAPVLGNTNAGTLYWNDGIGMCLKCLGIGQQDADSWGWGQDSTIDQAHCTTPAP